MRLLPKSPRKENHQPQRRLQSHLLPVLFLFVPQNSPLVGMLRAFVGLNVQPAATDLPSRKFLILLWAAGHLPSGRKISETGQRGAVVVWCPQKCCRDSDEPVHRRRYFTVMFKRADEFL